MEVIAKATERTSSYAMREDAVSDCEEWTNKFSQKNVTSNPITTNENGKLIHTTCFLFSLSLQVRTA